MPGGDGTGPPGAGSTWQCGRGGRGGGRGWRHQYRATGKPGWLRDGGSTEPTPPKEVEAAPENGELVRQLAALRAELEGLKRRLEEPKATPKTT